MFQVLICNAIFANVMLPGHFFLFLRKTYVKKENFRHISIWKLLQVFWSFHKAIVDVCFCIGFKYALNQYCQIKLYITILFDYIKVGSWSNLLFRCIKSFKLLLICKWVFCIIIAAVLQKIVFEYVNAPANDSEVLKNNIGRWHHIHFFMHCLNFISKFSVLWSLQLHFNH